MPVKNPTRSLTISIWINCAAILANALLLVRNLERQEYWWVAAETILCIMCIYQVERCRRLKKEIEND